VTRALLQAVHVGAWALCYGAITYTYYRLNGQMRCFVRSDDEYEGFAAATANGLHWWILGTTALAGATGVTLAIWTPAPPAPDIVVLPILLGVKTVFLFALIAVQFHVSRVMWPRRARAPRNTWPSERRRFFWVAYLMGFLLIAQLVLGALVRAVTDHAAF
jgi:hypothetical protein